MFLPNRVKVRILNWRNLVYLNFILKNYSNQAVKVMEIGSCTGRLLLNFKRRGALTFYNDLAIPEVEAAMRRLNEISGHPTVFILGDFLHVELPTRLDFTFSTGLFHTLPPSVQRETLNKMLEVSNSVYILVPDLSDKNFKELEIGANPGQIGSTKYELIDICKILASRYEYVQRGVMLGKLIGVNHNFEFFFGGSSRSNLESSRLYRVKYLIMKYFPIPSI